MADKLKDWAISRGHYEWCKNWQSGEPCNCGLDEALATTPQPQRLAMGEGLSAELHGVEMGYKRG